MGSSGFGSFVIGLWGLKFGLGEPPRPPQWTGWRVLPVQMEFWRDRPFRLHERDLYERDGRSVWVKRMLYP